MKTLSHIVHCLGKLVTLIQGRIFFYNSPTLEGEAIKGKGKGEENQGKGKGGKGEVKGKGKGRKNQRRKGKCHRTIYTLRLDSTSEAGGY